VCMYVCIHALRTKTHRGKELIEGRKRKGEREREREGGVNIDQ